MRKKIELCVLTVIGFCCSVMSVANTLNLDIQLKGKNIELSFNQEPGQYYILKKSLSPYKNDSWTPLSSHYNYEAGEKGLFSFGISSIPNLYFKLEKYSIDSALDNNADGDLYNDAEELEHHNFLKLLRIDTLSIDNGVRNMVSQSIYEQYAQRSSAPGTFGLTAMRFIVVGIKSENPILYFISSAKNGHERFVRSVLNYPISSSDFNKQTYAGDENRNFAAGYLIYHPEYVHDDGRKGVYVFQFWPGDQLKFEFIQKVYNEFNKHLQLNSAADNIYYYPSSAKQQNLVFKVEKNLYENSNIKVLTPNQLYGNIEYAAYLTGTSYGTLVVGNAETTDYSSKEIVLFESTPNELSIVGGIITTELQTELSHINLRAKQNNTPNCYIKNANSSLEHPELNSLIGKLVRLNVNSDGYQIREATLLEAQAHWDSIRPKTPQAPPSDLNENKIQFLTELRAQNARAYGAKAANLAELKIIPDLNITTPNAAAIPFYFYHQYMSENGFYDQAEEMMDNPLFQTDKHFRSEALDAFRKRIKKDGTASQELINALNTLRRNYPNEVLRFRSSTNNEDLVGFNGAGLYDSFTHHIGEANPDGGNYKDEGHILKSVLQVWSSLWTYRAFEERWYYNVDHRSVYMGVLVHPNYDHELANGVAVSKDIITAAHSSSRATYLNVSPGESLITNPNGAIASDELVVEPASSIRTADPNQKFQILFRSYHNEDNSPLLSYDETVQIHENLRKIKAYFQTNHNVVDIEIEFKINPAPNGDRVLAVKQVRPWVD